MFDSPRSLTILHKLIPSFPATLLVLGSGWNSVVQDMVVEKEIGYHELFGVRATVPGHEGKLIIGKLAKVRVACMSGRLHMYEGYTAYETTAPIRLFAQAGVKNLILTAACGALNESYRVGDVVVLNDMITLFLALDNPLRGPEFIDTSCVFDPIFRKQAVDICKKHGITFQEGSYVYYHGPNYETPGDKKAMRILGADVCGMSTIAETLVARSLNVRVLGLAFVTNLAFVKHDHKEVLREANKGCEKMKIFLAKLVKETL